MKPHRLRAAFLVHRKLVEGPFDKLRANGKHQNVSHPHERVKGHHLASSDMISSQEKNYGVKMRSALTIDIAQLLAQTVALVYTCNRDAPHHANARRFGIRQF